MADHTDDGALVLRDLDAAVTADVRDGWNLHALMSRARNRFPATSEEILVERVAAAIVALSDTDI